MSDIYNDVIGTAQKNRPVCRVAYTLNNKQPVICTIIGDQPLFYMDHNAACEDHESSTALDVHFLTQEIEGLKKEIEGLERFSNAPLRETTQKLEDFVSNKKEITEANPKARSQNIEDLITILKQSRLGAAYLQIAGDHNIKIQYCQQIQTAHYDRECGLITLNPALNIADQILLLAQELRRHWQHRQGALIHPLMFHPDNAILINRVQIADLAVSMVRIAWELQLSGEKRAWERLESSSMSDLGRAFAREAFLDFRTINNGLAATAVFESWFLSERCRAQDKILINQMLCDYQGYVFEAGHTEKNLTPSLISALGTMPFGKNYLAEHAVTIVNDTIFTDVRDRSNANFLWFIKFERSFRETEQELQTSTGPAAEDIRSSGTPYKIQDLPDETNAQIIPLYTGPAAEKSNGLRLSAKEDPAAAGKDNRSNVVYLRRWSGE
jgi:hypothetical protein